MDTIRIDELTCYGFHGALPEENRLGQFYQASIELELDLNEAAAGDLLAKTIDYREALSLAESVLSGPPCKLIETLAEKIAKKLLDAFPAVHAVTVEVVKPSPPVPHRISAVSAALRRSRDSQ